jgi:hypothetical protein
MQAEDFTRRGRGRVLAGKTCNKIFCVGRNKTGTTTPEGLLRLYGYGPENVARFLVIDITAEMATRTICDFLNIPAVFAIDMTQLSRT